VSENLDKSKHSLYNGDKKRGKGRPADEVTGTCAQRGMKTQPRLLGKEENPMGL